MADIVFNDNEFKIKSRVNILQSQTKSPAMVKGLIRHGIVKNEKQAFLLLFLFMIVLLFSSFVIIYLNFFKDPVIPELLNQPQILSN